MPDWSGVGAAVPREARYGVERTREYAKWEFSVLVC